MLSPLLTLPPELLLSIANQLPPHFILHFCVCNRRLAALLLPTIPYAAYSHDRCFTALFKSTISGKASLSCKLMSSQRAPGNFQVFSRLLSLFPSIDPSSTTYTYTTPDDEGNHETLLHIAAYGANPAITSLLLACGVDPYFPATLGGNLPIQIAAKNGYAEMVKTLMCAMKQQGQREDLSRGWEEAIWSATTPEVVRYLVEEFRSWSEAERGSEEHWQERRLEFALEMATRKNNGAKVVREFVKLGVKATPEMVHYAVGILNYKVVETLVVDGGAGVECMAEDAFRDRGRQGGVVSPLVLCAVEVCVGKSMPDYTVYGYAREELKMCEERWLKNMHVCKETARRIACLLVRRGADVAAAKDLVRKNWPTEQNWVAMEVYLDEVAEEVAKTKEDAGLDRPPE